MQAKARHQANLLMALCEHKTFGTSILQVFIFCLESFMQRDKVTGRAYLNVVKAACEADSNFNTVQKAVSGQYN
jgi:hypothetical protein